ncbi:MAG: hypothetical protein WBM50_12050 [Acidimicrobiales bacterium]
MATTLTANTSADTTHLSGTGTRREAEPLAGRIDARAAGSAAIIGVVLSIAGALVNSVLVDADVYAAMQTASATERAQLLTDVAGARTALVASFVLWMIAFPACAAASVLLARLGRQSPLTSLIRQAAAAATGAIIVFLSMFIAFVAAVAPAHVAGEDVLTLARIIGFSATTADWIVSAIVLGLAPAAAVYAGRGIWAPRWLQWLAALTVVVTVIEVIGLIIDNRDLAFPLVPMGLALIASAGICALRHNNH